MTITIYRPAPPKTVYPRCEWCHDTGMALYLVDTATNDGWGPYHNDGELYVKYDELQAAWAQRHKETAGKEGLSVRAFAFRFYATMAPCQSCNPVQREKRLSSRAAEKIRFLGVQFDTSRYDHLGWNSFAERCATDSTKAGALAEVQGYAGNGEIAGKHSLVLYGPNGTGKTGLMILLYRDCKVPCALLEYRDYISLIQDTYERKRDTRETLAAFQQVPVLFLDDLGDPDRVARATDDQRDKLYQLIEVRHKADLVTVITTNLEPAAMAKQFGIRILQRLQEMAAWVHVAGEVLR
jgi:DNA replication protein DnaC